MTYSGGCYCGEVRFACEGPARLRGQCLCRTCQKISGGAGNLFMVVDADGFRYTQGRPAAFAGAEPPHAPTREFCRRCGVHLAARSPRAPGVVLVKVGALDDPAVFGGPQVVVWTSEMQEFHLLPPDVPTFPGFPQRPSSGPRG